MSKLKVDNINVTLDLASLKAISTVDLENETSKFVLSENDLYTFYIGAMIGDYAPDDNGDGYWFKNNSNNAVNLISIVSDSYDFVTLLGTDISSIMNWFDLGVKLISDVHLISEEVIKFISNWTTHNQAEKDLLLEFIEPLSHAKISTLIRDDIQNPSIGKYIYNTDIGYIEYYSNGWVNSGLAMRRPIAFTLPLVGVLDNTFDFIGTLRRGGVGLTGDYTSDLPLSNNHGYIQVTAITTGGDMVVTGISRDETTSVVTVGDTETITLDTSTSQYYQFSKKWDEITNVNVSSGTITGITYNIGVVGYRDFHNNSRFKIHGYRIDCYAQSNSADFNFEIIKIKDDGNGKMSIVQIEDIGVDSGSAGNQIIDNLRVGAEDRSNNPASTYIWMNDTTLVFKQSDLDDYFTANENYFDSHIKDEGFFIRITGAPSGGISAVDYIAIELDYELIPD